MLRFLRLFLTFAANCAVGVWLLVADSECLRWLMRSMEN
jgi:hypothetical protein